MNEENTWQISDEILRELEALQRKIGNRIEKTLKDFALARKLLAKTDILVLSEPENGSEFSVLVYRPGEHTYILGYHEIHNVEPICQVNIHLSGDEGGIQLHKTPHKNGEKIHYKVDDTAIEELINDVMSYVDSYLRNLTSG